MDIFSKKEISKLDYDYLLSIKEDIQRNLTETSLPTQRSSGCGRVYVSFGKVRKNSKQMKFIESITGKKFTQRPYYSYQCLYVGYDNATGRELTLGNKIAKAFNSVDILAYSDGDAD